MKAVIKFDGGCKPTNPGNKYGSYSIVLDDVFAIEKCRFQLGYGTNNEAEWDSLLNAINGLIQAAIKSSVSLKSIDVFIFTDSTIVRNWIQKFDKTKFSKIKNDRRIVMGNYARQCKDLLNQFKSHEIQWHSRENNVTTFGH